VQVRSTHAPETQVQPWVPWQFSAQLRVSKLLPSLLQTIRWLPTQLSLWGAQTWFRHTPLSQNCPLRHGTSSLRVPSSLQTNAVVPLSQPMALGSQTLALHVATPSSTEQS
jgi:hypothetical protein